MHWIQNYVLQQLIMYPNRRFADLKPANVESNLFMYHLRKLLSQKLICKRDDGRYELTAEGMEYADRLSLKTFKPRVQPRIVNLVACQNDTGEWLLYRRKRQPLIGQVGFPYGKLHEGEKVIDGAHRELKEKTGLSCKLVHRGDGYITIKEDGETVSQVMFHLFYGKGCTGELIKDSTVGQAFWGDPATVEKGKLIASIPELIRLIKSNPTTRFFAELSFD